MHAFTCVTFVETIDLQNVGRHKHQVVGLIGIYNFTCLTMIHFVCIADVSRWRQLAMRTWCHQVYRYPIHNMLRSWPTWLLHCVTASLTSRWCELINVLYFVICRF